MAKYRLTPAAKGDLSANWPHMQLQWRPGQADRYIEPLEAPFAELAQ